MVVPGREARHILMLGAACEEFHFVSLSIESSGCLDTALTYVLSNDCICGSTGVLEPLATKCLVSSTNAVCGGTADEVVSVEVSDWGLTVGVVSDAPLCEFPVVDSLSSGTCEFDCSSSLFYNVRLFCEVADASAGRAEENTKIPHGNDRRYDDGKDENGLFWNCCGTGRGNIGIEIGNGVGYNNNSIEENGTGRGGDERTGRNAHNRVRTW